MQDAALGLGAQFNDSASLITIRPVAEGGTAPHNYLDVAISIVPAPVNDDFANAQSISGNGGAYKETNLHATKQPGEPNHAQNVGGPSVWYNYTPTNSGPMTFDTFGSSFNTLLGVYTGSFVSELQPIASNDDATSNVKLSRVTFDAVAGTLYHIAVDGFDGVSGNLALNFTPNIGVYSISTSSSPGNGGLTSGDGTFNGGSMVTLVATPSGNYAFVNWTENGVAVSNSASYTFTASATRTLVANFTPVLSHPLNLSTRAPVGVGDNVLIGGFIITGTEAKKIILRAIGPSLGTSLQGVPRIRHWNCTTRAALSSRVMTTGKTHSKTRSRRPD